MLQERLLERIRRIEDDPDHRGVTDPGTIIVSIMHHLQKILNTRQGSALIDEYYGMPDFTDLAATFSSESVRDLIRSIKHVINVYEPRLRGIQIETSPRGKQVLELHFKIEGNLAFADNISVPVAFETIVDPEGRIKVTG
ncbi:MAG: type VI secretion system baseplate subunit TssE [Pseudomonadota bacterium]